MDARVWMGMAAAAVIAAAVPGTPPPGSPTERVGHRAAPPDRAVGRAPVTAGLVPIHFPRQFDEAHEEAVRSFLVTRRTGLVHAEEISLAETIVEESQRWDVHPALVLAVIQTESSYRNWSTSDRNARGLMQLMPETAAGLASEIDAGWEGDESLYVPEVNVKLGIYYLRQLCRRYGSLDTALAAYNMGPTAVSRLIGRGVDPPRRYSRKVMDTYRRLREHITPPA